MIYLSFLKKKIGLWEPLENNCGSGLAAFLQKVLDWLLTHGARILRSTLIKVLKIQVLIFFSLICNLSVVVCDYKE